MNPVSQQTTQEAIMETCDSLLIRANFRIWTVQHHRSKSFYGRLEIRNNFIQALSDQVCEISTKSYEFVHTIYEPKNFTILELKFGNKLVVRANRYSVTLGQRGGLILSCLLDTFFEQFQKTVKTDQQQKMQESQGLKQCHMFKIKLDVFAKEHLAFCCQI